MIARLDISAAPASDCSFWPAAREDRSEEKRLQVSAANVRKWDRKKKKLGWHLGQVRGRRYSTFFVSPFCVLQNVNRSVSATTEMSIDVKHLAGKKITDCRIRRSSAAL